MDKATNNSPRIAIITGANTGVGYAVAQRLAIESPQDLIIILACRNKAKATEAQEALIKEYARHQQKQKQQQQQTTDKRVEFVVEVVDVGRAGSVIAFNARIQQQYRKIDYLFCNAGILPSTGIQYGKLFKEFFTDPLNLVIRSDVLMQPKQSLTEDGVANVFACNVFGHYLMIKGLEDQLDKTAEDPGRVIWTGSMTAEKAHYDIMDFQGMESAAPYESTKWATDLLAIRLNTYWEGSNSDGEEKSASTHVQLTPEEPKTGRLTRSQSRLAAAAAAAATEASGSSSAVSSRTSSTVSLSPRASARTKRHIRSITTDPGVVASSMGDLSIWLIWVRIMLHYIVRFVFAEASQNITAHHGAQANVAAALKQPASDLDPRKKMGSRVNPIGREFLSLTTVEDYDDADGEAFLEKIELMRQDVLAKVSS
ncbi:hypothetical protein BGZ73_004812 [Actinomortierella ambigua]|nr:hypothetical protein BGZ73_004812 [Actinomortierella ambigua]